jgi:Protein of unknown function (DUF2924)
MKVPASETLPADIAEIEGLERAACLERWQCLFGRPPPKCLSPQFMQRVLIREIQCQILGGVPAKTERALKRLAVGKAPPTRANPGSHLIHEWNGRAYQVEVTGDGYVMDGKSWRSLSAIARHITGAQWSGPRFFGLT